MATASPASYLAELDAAWQAQLAPRASDAPTVVSLFAGGGGSSLGYRMAGYRELLAVEWDSHAVETLGRNLPEVPIWEGDIGELSIAECLRLAGLSPGELDVLDGSPPCQGFSTAGKRQLPDGRNGLWQQYVRLLDDRYGRLWDRVPRGGCAADVVGKGFSNCVKPRPDRSCCTLPKTQTGRGFATVVHPTEPRALSVLEAKLISSFPPQYQLTGSYAERWARTGNAVPAFLIRAIATHLWQTIFDDDASQRDVA